MNDIHTSLTKQLGNKGEEVVAHALVREGFSVLAQNFRCKTGEVDIIALKGSLLVFVEVKTRKHAYFPIATVVVPSKQRKIVSAAKYFMCKHGIDDKVCRFDVATVICEAGNRYSIDYISDAFRS